MNSIYSIIKTGKKALKIIQVQGLIKNEFASKALSSMTVTWCSVPPGKISPSESLFNFFNILLSGLPWNPLGQSRANPSYTNVAFLDFNTRLGCLKGDGACQELNIATILRIICDGQVKERERERRTVALSLLPSWLPRQASWAPSRSISPAPRPYGEVVMHDHMDTHAHRVSFFFLSVLAF